MNFYSTPLGELGANCYLLDCGNGIGAAIDIGSRPDRLRRLLNEHHLTLKAILLTHGHYDHIGGVEEMRAETGATVYIHEEEEAMLYDGKKNLAYQIAMDDFTPVKSCVVLHDEQVLTIGDAAIQVLHTPGHTPGGVCYLTENLIFTGDTLFSGGIGRIDLGGNAQDMKASLRRLLHLKGEYEVCPGHGESSTLAWEREHNPYLRDVG